MRVRSLSLPLSRHGIYIYIFIYIFFYTRQGDSETNVVDLEVVLRATHEEYGKTTLFGNSLVVLIVHDLPLPAVNLAPVCETFMDSYKICNPKVTLIMSVIIDRPENARFQSSEGSHTRGRGGGGVGGLTRSKNQSSVKNEVVLMPKMLFVTTISDEIMGFLATTHDGVQMAVGSMEATRCWYMVNDLKRTLTPKEIANQKWSNSEFDEYCKNLAEHVVVSKITSDKGLKYPWEVIIQKQFRCDLNTVMVDKIDSDEINFIVIQTMKPQDEDTVSLSSITFGSISKNPLVVKYPASDHHDIKATKYDKYICHANIKLLMFHSADITPVMPGFLGPFSSPNAPGLVEVVLCVTNVHRK